VQVFGEREHPPEAVGLLQDSPEYAQIREETWRRFEQNDTSHPGEETFAMLAERAAEAVEYLKKRKENNIVVVSHSNFIRFLVAYMCWGEMLTPRFFIKFLHFAKISNTGITHLVFEEGKWTLHQWNDKAHLG
jgi:broad specificity phosphatase PhoE